MAIVKHNIGYLGFLISSLNGRDKFFQLIIGVKIGIL